MKLNVTQKVRAFTLIEILLAIGIFSLVMAALYTSWSAILRGSRMGLAAAAEVQRTRVAVRSLEEALGSAVLYADNPEYYSFFVDTTGEYAYLSFVSRLPESFPGSGLFPGQSLRRVTFMVDGDRNLKLTQTPLLEASQLIEQPYTIQLAPSVTTFAAEFFDARKHEWYADWPFTNQIPQMVRIAIGFGKKQEATPQTVTMRVIPLSAIAITRAGGTAGGARIPRPNPGGPGDMDDPGDLSFAPRLSSSFSAGDIRNPRKGGNPPFPPDYF
jgi:type II secretion system protein J